MSNIIKPNHEFLVYRGRYDDSDIEAPVFGFPYSGILVTFEGSEITVMLKNKHVSHKNYLGVIVDGKVQKYLLEEGADEQIIKLVEGLEEIKHEVFVYKCSDLSNQITILGFDLGERGKLVMPRKQKRKLIEFYGDSVTAGQYVEAKSEQFPFMSEEEKDAYTNPYYSYAAIVGRLLHARVNLIAQSKVAFADGQGGCDVGMETLFDKASFDIETKTGSEWNFKKEEPTIVIVSLGQYDGIPDDFMKEDMNGEQAEDWKGKLRAFITKLRKLYPKTLIVLTTSILRHSPKWDRAIGQVCTQFNENNVIHFLYNENARGAHPFVNIAQSEKMALELNAFLLGLENTLWS